MVTQLQLPDDMIKRFDELAYHTGQSREDVMRAVLEDYLVQIAEEDTRIDEARAEVARGDVVDAEVVYAEASARLLARGITPAQMAAIKAEAEQEAAAFYGVSLCE